MSADPMLLRRASRVTYAYGWYTLAVGVVAILTVVIMMLSLFSTMFRYPYSSTSWLPSFFQTLLYVYLPPLLVVSAIQVVIALSFSFYLHRVGKAYDVSSLRAGSYLIALAQAVSLLMSLAIYAISVSIVSAYQSIASLLQLTYTFMLIVLPASAIGIAYMVLLIVGSGRMVEKTGVKAFDTARILMIVGIFIAFLFPIGLIKFGSGLKELTVVEKRTTCPSCGKRVYPDAAFCMFCGARLKKEQA
jgi:hypothetical protein